jgi:hypothetical protein
MAVQLSAYGISGRPVDGGPPVPWRDAWTPAPSEAARFLGECGAVGAVLDFLTELTRLAGERRARPPALSRGAERPSRLRAAGCHPCRGHTRPRRLVRGGTR